MDIVYKVIIVLIPMILSLTVHEFAHAWSAWKLGDDTAKRNGRLTLNPAAHIDPIGTLLLPIILTISGSGFFFGWAKPVPVNRVNFRRGISMKAGDIITAVAGPASNLIMAFFFGGALVALYLSMKGSKDAATIGILFERMFAINIALAVFNMLPIPPLDGHYLLPDGIQDKIRQHQMLVFVGLILFINVFSGVLAVPILAIMNMVLTFWQFVIGGFVG